MDPAAPFVSADFEPPRQLVTPAFVLEPLGVQHNESDYAAWSSSLEHIRATPGFASWSWPHEMTLEENRSELERHSRDFEQRKGFTFTVLDPSESDVIGCVYIYPARDDAAHDAAVQSWVRADRAELDEPLWRAVGDWLREAWPFQHLDYAPRP